MNLYKVLSKHVFTVGGYSLVPIRHEDRYNIMDWRNEQIYHLRQQRPLTKEQQDEYFSTTVSALFDQSFPQQVLFSYMYGENCLGYGGLVHINWNDKNAEISFLMNSSLEPEFFEFHWTTYLNMIEEVAFDQLGLHKIYTYAFDLRPRLYKALESCDYQRDAVLKEHAFFGSKYIDVVIHSKYNDRLSFVTANENHQQLTYAWASSDVVRKYSFSKDKIDAETHRRWFHSAINDKGCFFFIAYLKGIPIGSIRFNRNNGEDIISFLLDPEYHGKGLGKQLLEGGILRFFQRCESSMVTGYVMASNLPSIRLFQNLNFQQKTLPNGTIKFTKKRHDN